MHLSNYVKQATVLFTLVSFGLFACNSDYIIKPRGYFNIPLPQKNYKRFQEPGYPYSFEYPVYGTVSRDTSFFEAQPESPYWINIDFPELGFHCFREGQLLPFRLCNPLIVV